MYYTYIYIYVYIIHIQIHILLKRYASIQYSQELVITLTGFPWWMMVGVENDISG